MSNKKLLFLIAFLLMSFLLIQAKAAEIDEETCLPSTIKNISDVGKKLTDEEARAGYLKQEWTKLILKNKVLAALNSFFTKISIVFRVLFGMPYSISLTL